MRSSDADLPTPFGRSRRRCAVLWSLLILGLLVAAAGCAPTVVEVADDRVAEPAPTSEFVLEPPMVAEAPQVAPVPNEDDAPAPITDLELPSAKIGFEGLEAPQRGPMPVTVEIEGINVVDASVIPVGVNEDLSFEVPPADQVGWYQFGPIPGEPGSAVLAGHIAYNGVDGVFRNLRDVEIGAIVVVGFDDGTSQRYRIEELVEYVKEALPDELFARSGDAQIALITCGGAFNYQLDSYESNTVAIAVPL